MNASVYRNAFTYIAKTYFTQPNYYKAPTKLANGRTTDCPFVCFWDTHTCPLCAGCFKTENGDGARTD